MLFVWSILEYSKKIDEKAWSLEKSGKKWDIAARQDLIPEEMERQNLATMLEEM